jgi:hypothetical protein
MTNNDLTSFVLSKLERTNNFSSYALNQADQKYNLQIFLFTVIFNYNQCFF